MSMASPLKIAVVGVGAFGWNHVRLLSGDTSPDLVGIFDADLERAAAVGREFGVAVLSDLDEVRERCDAAVVAVPTVAHAAVGCQLLEAGLHVLVEKPIAAQLEDADRLLAAAGDRVLAVGHVEYYNPGVQALLGVGCEPGYLEIQRLAEFTPRSLDIDVILDLMIHDLQILHALDESPVHEVRATGINVLTPRIDIANARIQLASGCVANITASRVSAERVRKLRAISTSRYFSLDYATQELESSSLQQVGDRRQIVRESLPVEPCEPLKLELEAFAAACRGESAPLADGTQGRKALATALAVSASIGNVGGDE